AYTSSPNDNLVHDNLVSSGRNDYVAAETLIDIMNDLKDPRRAEYFDPNLRENIGEVESVSTEGDVTTITFTGNIESEPIVGNHVYTPSSDPDVPNRLGIISAVG